MPSNLKIQHGVLDSVNNAWGRPDAIIARRRMQLHFPQVLKVLESKREESQEEEGEGNQFGTSARRCVDVEFDLVWFQRDTKNFLFQP